MSPQLQDVPFTEQCIQTLDEGTNRIPPAESNMKEPVDLILVRVQGETVYISIVTIA